MVSGRIRLAQAARHLIFDQPRDFNAVPVREHVCSRTCVQPLIFGRTDYKWGNDAWATLYADLDVHAKRLVRVWALRGYGYGESFVDLTRYVCP